MSYKKIIISLIVVIFLYGCGGGGGGGTEDNGSSDGNNQNTLSTQITRENSKELMVAAFALSSYSNDMVYSSSNFIYNLLDYSDNGNFNETIECDNTNGSMSLSGHLSMTDGTGELKLTENRCENNEYELETNGSITYSISDADQNLMPLNYKITFDSYETSSTTDDYSSIINGTITVSQSGPNSQIIDAKIKITDGNTGDYFETDDMRITCAVPAGYQPAANEVRINGTVNHSDFGTYNLKSGTSLMDYVKFTGNTASYISVTFTDEDTIIARLESDGDTSPEAYLYASINDIAHTYQYNYNPEIMLDSNYLFELNIPINISLKNVTDINNDFLDYSVNLIASPTGSQVTWSIDDDLNLVINTDRKGSYVFNLVVDDDKGGNVQQQINIRVPLDAPEVTLTQTDYHYTSGDLMEIDLSPGNPTEGPFTYSVSPSYTGLSISNEGKLTWDTSSAPVFFTTTSLNIKVSISNVDHLVEIPLSITLDAPGENQPVVRAGIEVPQKERNIHVDDFDNDGKTEILLTDNFNLIYTLENRNGTYVQDWVFPYDINAKDKKINSIFPADINSDGISEVIVQTGTEIKIINIIDNSIIKSTDISEFIVSSYVDAGRGMAVIDLDNNGTKEIVALFGDEYYGSEGVGVVLSMSDLGILWQTPVLDLGSSMGVGNVDNDSAMEIVFSGGYVYDGITHNNEWVYSEDFGSDIVVADFDGDSIDEIFANRGWNSPVVYDAIIKSPVFDFTEEEDVCSIAAGNLDADPEKELIIGDCQWGDISAYNVTSNSASEIWSINSQDHGAESLAVGDSDQDGVSEVIWGTGLSHTGEDSLVVFDSQTRTIDFRNVNPSQLGSPYLGGKILTNSYGDSIVAFAVADTDSGYEGSRVIAMDFDSGDLTISPELGENWTGYFDFCVADYDLDNTEEIFFSSASIRNGFITGYNVFDFTDEWSISGERYSTGDVTGGDANGDGYPDLATIWGSTVRLYDIKNQSLLWGSIAFTNIPEQVEIRDLNSDNVPEILILSATKIVIYEKSGTNYFEKVSFTDADRELNYMLIDDVDGDHEIDIVVSDVDDFSYNDTSNLLIFDRDLNLVDSLSVDGNITSMETMGNQDNTLLIGISDEPYYDSSAKSFIELINIPDSRVIWKSMPLLGAVSRDSMHIIRRNGSSSVSLAVGTSDAMYLFK